MDQKLLKAATLLAVLGLVAFLVINRNDLLNDTNGEETPVAQAEPDPDSEAKRAALRETVLGTFGIPQLETSGEEASPSEPEQDKNTLSLRVGVIGATPNRTEITSLSEFPHTRGEIRKAYANAKDRSCRLLVPGVAVSAPLSKPRAGQSGSLGRVTVMTLGLEFDATGPKKLPAVTRGQVNKYFAQHRLAVQPILYYDTNNRPYFGTDCQAAFYELARPGLTVKAESMIGIAVGRFRALGVVADQSNEASQSTNLGRTLALAFTFAKKDVTVTGASDTSRYVTEVMLLHLSADCTADDPKIQVFITSDQRMNLHRLETRGMRLNSPTPLVLSDIRFNKTVLMGMYPADPVVSGIRYRSAGILSMETIRRLSRPDGNRPGVSLSEILDQFGKLAVGDEI